MQMSLAGDVPIVSAYEALSPNVWSETEAIVRPAAASLVLLAGVLSSSLCEVGLIMLPQYMCGLLQKFSTFSQKVKMWLCFGVLADATLYLCAKDECQAETTHFTTLSLSKSI